MVNYLENIVKEAYDKVPYYKKKYNDINLDFYSFTIDDFYKLPILNKEEILNNLNDLVSSDYILSDRKLLKTVRTSGSTGKFTEVYWKHDDFLKSGLVIWRYRKEWYDILPTSKCLLFNDFIYYGNRIHSPNKIEYFRNDTVLGLSKYWLNDSDAQLYVEEIKKFKPEWLIIQTSTLLRLIEICKNYSYDIFESIKYIELNGELVTQSNMKYFREFFKVPVSNMYGANEVNSIALECPYHNFHILDENVYLETQKINGINTAIVTSLKNTVMPMIRYNLGDEINIRDNENLCRCGCKLTTIDIFKGRSVDRILLKSGNFASPYILLYCIEKVNLIMNYPIVHFKIIQNSIDILELNIVINSKFKNWSNSIIKELQKQVDNYFPITEIKVEINIKDSLFEFSNSKYKLFQNNIS